MIQLSLTKVYDFAHDYLQKLEAKALKEKKQDPRFHYAVYILHTEGSSMLIRNAFLIRYATTIEQLGSFQECVFNIIFAEHHSVLIYPEDEAQAFLFKEVEEEVENIENRQALKRLKLIP